MSGKILLVEDDAFLREGLAELLEKEGYSVDTASDRSSADRKTFGRYDIVILDVRLPDGSGLDLCREIRRNDNKLPILFLTACDDENEIVAGLDSGADDYVTKPFGIKVLLSRIRALLRRNPSDVWEGDGLSVDIENMNVKLNGKAVFLTPTEFQILSLLIRNRGIVVTRNRMLDLIWDSDGSYIDDNTLSVHISRLREKIGTQHIKTVRGVGYRWE